MALLLSREAAYKKYTRSDLFSFQSTSLWQVLQFYNLYKYSLIIFLSPLLPSFAARVRLRTPSAVEHDSGRKIALAIAIYTYK
jgi:hypothetical protein